jgi:hypothetical protein
MEYLYQPPMPRPSHVHSQLPLSRSRRGYQRTPTPPTILGGTSRAPAAVAHDRQQINQWLAHDPLFNVLTFDGGGWIDPFTGAVIRARESVRKAAKRHLLKNRPWMKFGLRSYQELLVTRWAHHLQRVVEADSHLRIFRKDGAWLNAYTGAWEPEVPLENGKVTFATIQAMATVLARSPELKEPTPLALAELNRRVAETRVISTSSGRFLPVTNESRPVAQPAQDGYASAAATERNTDLSRAKAVIERMLPQLPAIPGWELGLCYEPHSVIGGDFYDLIRIDDRHLFVAMGDVSGHGTSAALVVASTLKSLRHAVREGGNLAEIMVRFNDDIQVDLLKSFFITMFAGLIDLEARVMTCVCAGHHPALLGNPRRRSVLIQLGNPAPAIGLMTGDVFTSNLESMTVQLRPGDTIMQFTDGLFEAVNGERQPYGRRRVMASLLLAMDEPAPTAVKRMVGGARRFTGGRFADDVTALIIKVLER